MRHFSVLFALFCLVCIAATATADENYPLSPDSLPQSGVPRGKVTEHVWKSPLYGGTLHKYYLYIPAQYRPSQPAALMVFQEGSLRLPQPGTVPTSSGW